MSYSIENRPLNEIRKSIKEKIIEKIEENRAAGQSLEAVKTIIYGDRANIKAVDKMPAIWIIPGAHFVEAPGGHMADHDFSFNFVTMVYNNRDTDEGREQAEELNALLYDVINSMRRSSGFFDVRAVSYDPSFEAVANSAVFWAACEFIFRIKRQE